MKFPKKCLIPESCTKYRSEAPKALCLKRSWSDSDPQAYYLYGEDQNHETSFKGKALQATGHSWCKIQVITSCLILALVVGLSISWGFENEPKVFRGIKWGTDVNDLPDMIFHTQSGESKVYFRKNDKLKIGAANLLQVWYFFSKDKLYSVVIMFEEWSNFNALKTELFKLHGTGYAPDRFTEEYRWIGSDVIVFFDYNEIDNKGRLAYYYLPIMKEQLEENTETGKADDNP